MRRALLAALLGLAIFAPAARASIDQLSMVMDDNRLLYRGDAVGRNTIKELSALGVDAIRVSVHWRAIAPAHQSAEPPPGFDDPTDPDQYPREAFHSLDRVLRDARAAHMEVLFNVTGGAPLWATGTLNGHHVSLQYKPDPKQFTEFMQMLGRRYDGTWPDPAHPGQDVPRVTLWSLWNEPNQGALLQPQWQDGKPYSPRLYRRLARGGLLGLSRSGHGRDRILLGETAPIGVDRTGIKANMRPALFLRELLCLDSWLRPRHGSGAASRGCDFARRGPLLVAGYAHHPYSITWRPDQGSSNTDDITLADRDRLTDILDAAARADHLPEDLPLWWTEYGYQTYPPDPIRGVSLDEQAVWLGQAEAQTYADPRVACMTQFLLRDDLPRADAEPDSTRYWGTYQSGLEFADGKHKPAYDAYRLPFFAPTAVSAGAPLTLWGRVRPLAAGDDQHVQLQFSPEGGDGWEDVGEPLTADQPGGVFVTTVTAGETGRWRFRWSPGGGPSSPRASSGGSASYASAPVPVAVAGVKPEPSASR